MSRRLAAACASAVDRLRLRHRSALAGVSPARDSVPNGSCATVGALGWAPRQVAANTPPCRRSGIALGCRRSGGYSVGTRAR